MKPRITISNRTLNKIKQKVNYALDKGDMRIYKKAKAMAKNNNVK